MTEERRTRIAGLLSQLEREFEELFEENQSLRLRLGVPVLPEQSKKARFLKLNLPTKGKKGSLTPRWDTISSFVAHRDVVSDVATCSWNETLLGSASYDRTARIWSVNSNRSVTLSGFRGAVNSIRFHPTQRLVLTASGDGSAHLFKIPQSFSQPIAKIDEKADEEQNILLRTPITECKSNTFMLSAAFLSGGDTFAGVSGNTVRVWTLNGENVNSTTQKAQTLLSVSAHPSQHTQLCVCGTDGFVRIGDLRTPNRFVEEFQAQQNQCLNCAYANHGQAITTSGFDTVKTWDCRNLKSPRGIFHSSHPLLKFSLSPKTNRVVIPTKSYSYYFIDIDGRVSAKLKSTPRARLPILVCSVWAGDESVVFSGGLDKKIRFWTAV